MRADLGAAPVDASLLTYEPLRQERLFFCTIHRGVKNAPFWTLLLTMVDYVFDMLVVSHG